MVKPAAFNSVMSCSSWVLVSSTSGAELFLSPHVLDIDPSVAAYIIAHELGHAFHNRFMPDGSPAWDEYRRSVRFRGRMGAASIRLVESVRQDRKRGLTVFDQEFIETRRGQKPKTRRFSLAFRTLPVPNVVSRLEKAGFDVEHILGDYRGGQWDDRADVWLLLARRTGR